MPEAWAALPLGVLDFVSTPGCATCAHPPQDTGNSPGKWYTPSTEIRKNMATVEFTPENQKHFDFWMHGDGTLSATPKGRTIDCDACGEFYHEDYIGACNDDGMAYCEDCHVGCPCLEDW